MEFKYRSSSHVPDERIREHAEKLAPYIAELRHAVAVKDWDRDESSMLLPDEMDNADMLVRRVREKSGDGLKYVLLVGIGGSNLGAKAVYDAMHYHSDLFDLRRRPRKGTNGVEVFFIDTLDAGLADAFTSFIEAKVDEPEEVLVIMVSKSGTTTEPAANAELIHAALAEKFGAAEAAMRLVVVTDEGTPLYEAAAERGIHPFVMPRKVGGRYSVFSEGGLVPLAAAGFDVKALLGAARDARDASLSDDVWSNPAALSAAILYSHYLDGRRTHDMFVFGTKYESLGRWARQLMGESLGKRESLSGAVVHAGFTPTVSVGSTDLHSVGQLYLGGPKDKVTTFVFERAKDAAKVPEKGFFGTVKGIGGKGPHEILAAIYGGVTKAYRDEELPYMEAVIHDFYDVPSFMQWKMMETMYLGRLMNVNAFDQPAVESYKSETRRLLNN